MTSNESNPVDESARKGLEGTRFEASSLRPLTGGIVNWGYVATLKAPLDDGTTEIFIKHGEKYMATIPDFPLDLDRCVGSPLLLSHSSLTCHYHKHTNTLPFPSFSAWKPKSSP